MDEAQPESPVPLRTIRVGTAGWTLPKQHAQHFPETGTHLERSAQGFNCVEVNSSFHRPHQRKTWERWARCTAPDFRFAVKLPKAITHTALLANSGELLSVLFEQIRGLGEKLGPLLVQLPPKLAFDEALARDFFTTLRELHPQHPHTGFIALEPRHASWFTPPVDRLLRSFEIARVAADPPKARHSPPHPVGGMASATGDSTAHPALTIPHTTQRSFAASRGDFSTPPAQSSGPSSTTLLSATRPATRLSSSATCNTLPHLALRTVDNPGCSA